jgi:hypothetical protein
MPIRQAKGEGDPSKAQMSRGSLWLQRACVRFTPTDSNRCALALEHRDIDEFNIVNARILDSSGNEKPLRQAVCAAETADWMLGEFTVGDASCAATWCGSQHSATGHANMLIERAGRLPAGLEVHAKGTHSRIGVERLYPWLDAAFRLRFAFFKNDGVRRADDSIAMRANAPPPFASAIFEKLQ